MKPGTRVVSNTFRMDSWIPDQEVSIRSGESTIGTLNETIYLWIVPANIDGAWEFTGLPNLDKTSVRFVQKKQFFDGTIAKWIEEGIEILSSDQERMEWFTTSGNALVLVYREEPGDMIHVYITKIEHQGYVEINN